MKKRGQVWIETVTYTLVAFVLIGLVLAFAKPKIEELQDQAVIDQSIKIMNQIDSVINEVYEKGLGNKRKLEVSLRKGELQIDSVNNSILFTLKGKYEYSQPGQTFQEGTFNITTTSLGDDYQVDIQKDYSNLNLSYFEQQEIKIFGQASTPYTIFIANKGGAIPVIDFEIE